MKKQVSLLALIILFAVTLIAGILFAQTNKLSRGCTYKEIKGKNGQVQYVLSGTGCKAVAAKINKQSEKDTKVYGCRCKCEISTGSNIWICRCCTKKQLIW